MRLKLLTCLLLSNWLHCADLCVFYSCAICQLLNGFIDQKDFPKWINFFSQLLKVLIHLTRVVATFFFCLLRILFQYIVQFRRKKINFYSHNPQWVLKIEKRAVLFRSDLKFFFFIFHISITFSSSHMFTNFSDPWMFIKKKKNQIIAFQYLHLMCVLCLYFLTLESLIKYGDLSFSCGLWLTLRWKYVYEHVWIDTFQLTPH